MSAYHVADESLDSADIAVVGMAVRLPGALDVFDYWRNLRDGVESIRMLSDEELRAAGEDGAVLHDPNYVRAAAVLERLELFDAALFGFSKREATVLDPQHRHFLEVCVEALEDAGVIPETFGGAIGVFGGSGMNAYMPYNLFTNPELMRSMGLFLVRHTGNDKDFLTTRVSYCLNLKGPSVNVQTACSTSLVAIHVACQSLLAGECDLALAGGVTIELPHYRGYRYEEGEILSPDGHCRPFEARSKGTVFGSGAGVVVLRRLRDAVERGDHIHAIVKGSAANNDGNRKVGYLAPSVDGQAECVVEALQVAGLSGRDISYIECHGTGTPVGDPIEVAALAQAFSRSTTEKAFCGIGSVKSNIGHLDTAAGVASFVKAVHMLQHEQQVRTLHFEKPNPQIDFSSTPFFVVGESRRWPRSDVPRRAGVSSLGVGGTNAHVIVEEAPARRAGPRRALEVILVSARSKASLAAYSARLAAHFAEHPELELAEVSSTLLRGRKHYPFRRVLSAGTLAEAGELLSKPDPARVFDVQASKRDVPVLFMFPGGGAQHSQMARELYETQPKFRESIDASLDVLKRQEQLDLTPLLLPAKGDEEAATRELERPSLALPALFTVTLAFARLLESWGILPAAMIGHSLGEYAAAHLAGALSLEAVLGILCCRGRLFERVKKGGMLSVPLPPAKLEPLLTEGLSIAAINAPELCVVSGENAALDALEQLLAKQDVQARRLHIDVPAHSPLLEPILDDFRTYLRGIEPEPPALPYVSNLTGAMMVPADLSVEYFVRHLRSTVRFADGLATLLEAYPNAILVEVGPGQTLSSLARLQPAYGSGHAVVPLSPHVKDTISHALHLQTSAGRILAHGGGLDLEAFTQAPRRIVPLPTTPFEHERHWIEPGAGYFMARAAIAETERESDIARWFYTKVYREEPRAPSDLTPGERWLILAEGPLARSLPLEARSRGIDCVLLTPGERSEKVGPGHYSLQLSDPEGYGDVLQSIVAEGGLPRRFLHALCLSPALLEPDARPDQVNLDRAFFSLFHLAQQLGQEELFAGSKLLVATSRAGDVANTSTLRPLHALVEGPVLVVPKELPDLSARAFDLLDVTDPEAAARALIDELCCPSTHALVAERARTRYVGTIERTLLEDGEGLKLPPNPVVLFTGGLGGIARTVAAHFATTLGARIALISRSAIPDREARRRLRDSLDSRDARAEQLDELSALEDAGVELVVEQADVSSASELSAAVERVRRRFARIDVAIHAAGVLDDAPLALKDRSAALAVLAPKAVGARNLVDALATDPPALLVLLSSTSAALGPPGQIDYVAANSYVNALARRLRQSSTRSTVVGLGFGVWRDTGMAARATGPYAPGLEGEPFGHPLLERELGAGTDSLEFQSLYDPGRLWVLDEHRLRGACPVLPGTAMLEIVRAAGARRLGAPAAIELADLVFVRPLAVPDGERRLVRVSVKSGDTPGTVLVTLLSRGREDRADVEHATATVSPLQAAAPAPLPVDDLFARCSARVVRFDEGQQVLPQDQQLAFGPRWRVIREMRFGADEAIARIVLPEAWAADLAQYGLHPAMLDMVSGFAFSLADRTGEGDRLRVPLSYQHVRVHGVLPREVVAYARLKHGSSDGVAVFDVWLADATGRVLVEIQGYTTKSVPPATLSAGQQAAREPTLLQRWSRLGISREEGATVIERLLRAEPPAELYATPVSLYAMLEQLQPKVERPSRPSSEQGHSNERAEPENAPRDDVERRLADIWCSLLGVDSVGIHDNFFDLGGHSLIAVRLFARIKKAYGVDLALAVLFQAPTIEKCAAVVRAELGIELKQAKVGSGNGVPGAAPAQRAFTHVVEIQQGNGQVPFFCVHGAGGNVLMFRELAQQLGADRPFFGIQARGVRGEAPATSIHEMADLYFDEIRAVQARGPYLLGGYSGGGVVAYELAQRLKAAGDEVALVALFDTFHPNTTPRKLSLRERVEKLLDRGPRYLSERGLRHLNDLSVDLKLLYYERNNLPPPLELRNSRLFRAFTEAAMRYRPLPYKGHVVLFRARIVADIYDHVGPTLGWGELVEGLEVIEVPGGHDSLLLEPNVQVLTAQLARVIEQATSEAPSLRSEHA